MFGIGSKTGTHTLPTLSTQSVKSAPANARGFDTDTKLTTTTAQAFVQAGFTFAIRYLSLGVPESSGDLTSAEAQDILNSGLALMAVQHVPESGWWPTQELGQQYGQSAAQNAQTAGLPAGMNIWLDLEGVNSGASADNVEAYCNAWYGEVSAAKYVPGIYLGYDIILDSDQLDTLQMQYYWKSGSDSGSSFDYPYPANGFCMVQSISSSYEIDQVTYDSDVTQKDNLGNTPLWFTGQRNHLVPHGGKTPEGTPKTAKSKSVGMVAICVAVGILMYVAGVFTGPMILPATGDATHQPGKPASSSSTPSSQSAPAKTSTPPPSSTPPAVPADSTPKAVPALSTNPPVAAPEKKPAVPVPESPKASLPSQPVLIAGSFSRSENAEQLALTLERAGFGRPTVSTALVDGRPWHVVRLGPYRGRDDATRVASQLERQYDLHPSIVADGGKAPAKGSAPGTSGTGE